MERTIGFTRPVPQEKAAATHFVFFFGATTFFLFFLFFFLFSSFSGPSSELLLSSSFSSTFSLFSSKGKPKILVLLMVFSLLSTFHLRQLASNKPSRFEVLFNILIYDLSFLGSSVGILHGSKGDLTYVFCHHWLDVNPEPCTRMVVQSLFDTHPSYLASKWQKFEAVNSWRLTDLLDIWRVWRSGRSWKLLLAYFPGNMSWHKYNTVTFWWCECLVNKSNNSLSWPPSAIRSSNTSKPPFGTIFANGRW